MNDSEVIGKIQSRLYEPPSEQQHHLDCPATKSDWWVCKCEQIYSDLEQMSADYENKARLER